MKEAIHAPVVLDIAGLALERRRPPPPGSIRSTGGLILFARNWRDRRQLTELVAEIKALRPDVLVCVDHEGGRVQRFRSDGFTHLPPMRVLGEMWMDDGRGAPGSGAMRALEAATAAGHVLGDELRACGVDLSFTPVLDLDHGGSGVIGDRAFHRDPRVVAAARQEPDARPARRPACATAASTSRGTASSRPTATPRCRSTALARRRSWPTTRGRTNGSPARSRA